MTRFRPGLWPTVLTLPALAILIGLGVWQLQRLDWKENLIARVEERMAQAPVSLPEGLSEGEDLEYTPVVVEGRYLHERELYWGSRLRDGVVGFHVVTPFELVDGRQVLIDRGWVPRDRRDPETRGDGLVEGRQRVEGVLREGGWSGFPGFAPANDPDGNLWLWPDLEAMAEAAALENPVTGIYIDAAAGQHPGAYPVGGRTRVEFKNDHLSYAITWFGLAAGLAAVYLIFGLRRARES